jgi:fatty-acyl-CoA synthase
MAGSENIYTHGLEQSPANYTPLSPLSLLARCADVYPDFDSVIYGERRFTWSETYRRCRRLASALAANGIGEGDTVAVMSPNTPAIYEAHFGVPMCGAVLNALNIRLDAATIAFILEHGEARVLITDREFSPTIEKALEILGRQLLLIDIDDPNAESGELLGSIEYESFLAGGDPNFAWHGPGDEWNAIALNYTSGTTGNPKGVVYHHRGAYLNAVSNIVGWNLAHHPVYLWTLPMFHCNGWCFPWTLAAVAGTSVCTRKVDAKTIYDSIADLGVSHFCGAPIVLGIIINAREDERRAFDHPVNVMTAAAPPPASVLAAMEAMGFNVSHVYGLTETYGPAVMCAWKPEWDSLDEQQRAVKKSRQGVRYHMLEGLEVMNPETMTPVARDGETIGEIMFRGNIVMKGYLKNPTANAGELAGGWFHSGDLAVVDPDGYLQIKDRSKDVIISGGENISSIEVENILYNHPDVLEAAVAARPDDKWGETPCAFVNLKPGSSVSAEQIIEFCRQHMAHFKCPKTVVFGELPKTSTGKIQKFKLRAQSSAMGSL